MNKLRSGSFMGIVTGMTMVLSLAVSTTAFALTASDIAMLQAAGIISAAQAASLSASISSTPASTGSYTRNLTVGSTGADVTALQNMLGISPATGYFGSKTKAAVIAYQLSKGISPAAGFVGSITRASLNGGSSSVPGPVVYATGTDLKVSLALTSPMSGAVVAGQSIADLVEYTFTNTSSVPAVVTNVSLMRGGVSNDVALTNVYLYNGVTRLTDAASISQGKIAFNAPTGLFTVPAGSSLTVAIRADIAAGTTYNGQIFIISLTGVTSNVPVSAVYPISGATQQISSATLAGVTVATTSPATTSIDPQNDYVMWQGTISVTNNDVWIKALALRQVGSVAAGDLNNFRFYVDGVQVGGTLSSYDVNSYLTFDFSANPLKAITGSHTIKLLGDIIGGSTKNFSFSLRQASDINVVDSQLNVNVLATATTGSFPLTSGVQSVNAGSITITKLNDSPSGNTTLLSSGVSLARFQLKAAGEPVKVENLNVRFAGSNVGPLRNGALFANGAQIGSTADIASSTAGTTFNLGSSLVVYPGTPVTLEVRSDIYSSSGTQIVNGNNLTVNLVAGSSNANLLKSLGYISTPVTTGNQLTVAQGTLSLSKFSAYANQSVVAPQTAMKLGTYTLTAGITEDLLINTITVNFLGAGASTTATTTNITDVYLTFGNQVSSNKSTIASADNSYQVNYTLPAGQTQTINVYGTLSQSIGATDVVVTKLQVTGQTNKSIQTVYVPSSTTYTTGQTVSVTSGVLTPSAYAVAASSSVIAGNLVKVGSFKFVATGDTFTVDQLIGFVPFASAGNVANVVYKIGSTVLNPGGTSIDTSDLSNAIATTTGLNIVVPQNSSAGVIVDAYLQLGSIGTPGNATSSSNVLFTLNGFRKQTSTGIQTNVGGSALAGNTQYAYATLPTITNVALDDSFLVAGTKTLARFKISADAAGAVDWSMIKFAITKTSAVLLGATASNWMVTDDSGTQIPGTIATSTNLATAGVLLGNVTFTPTNLETVSGSGKTYRLKTAITGTLVSATESVTASIAQGTAGHIQSTSSTTAATNATFVWSDNSYTPHSATSPDWNNDILIKNIPTDSQTLSN